MKHGFRVYIDTSVFGGCSEKEFGVWSNALLSEISKGKKTAVISDITIKELSLAPREVRSVFEAIPEKHREIVALTKECEALAQEYIKEKAVSPKFEGDAYHIAIATVCRADVLVSWNFKHMVNVRRIQRYNAVNLKHGYSMIDIRSPREVIDEE
ncbi:MAG TPA: PIN domain protein [bacterium]|nr:PIN domain protein [bacterium]